MCQFASGALRGLKPWNESRTNRARIGDSRPVLIRSPQLSRVATEAALDQVLRGLSTSDGFWLNPKKILKVWVDSEVMKRNQLDSVVPAGQRVARMSGYALHGNPVSRSARSWG